jgi:hypothetical protein
MHLARVLKHLGIEIYIYRGFWKYMYKSPPGAADIWTENNLWYIYLIGIDGLGSVTNSVMDHPLALSDESPLQSPTLEYSSDYQGSTSSLNSVQSAMSKSSSFNMQNKGQFPGHGMCLTASDQDRIRIFIHEFAVRALIPWAERQMRTLNDMVRNFFKDLFTFKQLNYVNNSLFLKWHITCFLKLDLVIQISKTEVWLSL